MLTRSKNRSVHPLAKRQIHILTALLFAFGWNLLSPAPTSALPPNERLVLSPGSETFLRANFEVVDVVLEFVPAEGADLLGEAGHRSDEARMGGRPSNSRDSDLGSGDSRASDSKNSHRKSAEPQTSAQKAADDPKARASRTQDSRSQDSRSQDSRSQGSRTQDSRAQDSRSRDSRSPDSRSQDSRSQNSRSQNSRTQDSSTSVLRNQTPKSSSLPQVELLPAEEILLEIPEDSPSGQALVLAIGSDRLKAFDICISRKNGSDCPRPPSDEGLSKACPKVKETLDDGKRITTGDIESVECLDALKRVLEHSYDPPSSFRFILHEAPATVFYQRVLENIRKDPKTQGLKASYFGATLVLKGQVSRVAIGRALVHAYRETVGSVSYDDRTTRP